MGRSPFVGDGHDATFYIKGAETYPPCRIAGRKMAAFQSTLIANEASGLDAEAAVSLYFDRIADRLRGWSYQDDESGQWRPFCDDKGNRLPINAESLRSIEPKLYWRIRDIIMGTEPSDVEPAEKAAEKPATEAVQTNQADEGNCAAGSG